MGAGSGEAAYSMLESGDWLVGRDEADTVDTVIAYVPTPVQPSSYILLFDATDGSRPNLVENICKYVFENGAHKIVLRTLGDKPQYATKYGFTHIGTLHSEALSNDSWVDILLYERLHPDWAEEAGEVLEEVPLVQEVKNGRSRKQSRVLRESVPGTAG